MSRPIVEHHPHAGPLREKLLVSPEPSSGTDFLWKPRITFPVLAAQADRGYSASEIRLHFISFLLSKTKSYEKLRRVREKDDFNRIP